MDAERVLPGGRVRYVCRDCGAVAITAEHPSTIRHECPSGERRLPGWPTDPAEQLALLAGWLRAWHARHHDAGDIDAALARLERCLSECRHFTPARCALAGRGCDKRPTWWRWILAGECERFEPTP